MVSRAGLYCQCRTRGEALKGSDQGSVVFSSPIAISEAGVGERTAAHLRFIAVHSTMTAGGLLDDVLCTRGNTTSGDLNEDVFYLGRRLDACYLALIRCVCAALYADQPGRQSVWCG